MTCYKRSMLEDDANSLGSIHLTEGVSSTATHIRYHGAFWKWKERPKVKRFMLFCVLLILLVGISAMISLTLISTHRNAHDIKNIRSETRYCLSEKCIRSASRILTTMNHSVKPCDNFYEFACGRWMLSNPIPDGRSMWGMFNQLEQVNQLVIKNILGRENFLEDECEAEQKAKRYYTSCLDPNETTEALGAQPLLDLLEDLGGWSAIAPNLSMTDWNFQKTLEKLQNEYSIGALFFWIVAEDDKNSSQYVIQIDQPSLTLPSIETYKNLTNNTKLYNAYLDFMTTAGVLLGGKQNQMRRIMSNVLNFEAELAKIMTSDELRRDEEKIYKRLNISTLQNLMPLIRWRDFFENAFQLVNRTINNDEPIVLYAQDYLKGLNEILSQHLPNTSIKKRNNNQKLETLHHYLIWQAIRSMIGYMSKPFRESQKGLRKVLYGSEGSLENWRYCITDTNSALGFALGALYVRETFDKTSKIDARKMINNIRDAFKENFDKLKWMDASTSLEAKKKADAIIDMIGFPDYILDVDKLNKKYDKLVINESEYFANNIRLNKFKMIENLSKLDNTVNKTTWLMVPSTVNAYYSPNANRIVFPAGILQAPFYDHDHQLALNYGGIGVVMGHELTHAFDDQGREYDMYGNLNQWWKNETIEKFKIATKCVVDQYSKLAINGKHINGVRTLGENIADNGGLKAAYHAYQNLKKSSTYTYALPGLNYTQDQLFFISFAQTWCSSCTKEATSLQLDRDVHSPSEHRVNAPLQNLKEFSDVFGCKKHTHMNPEMKCEIW